MSEQRVRFWLSATDLNPTRLTRPCRKLTFFEQVYFLLQLHYLFWSRDGSTKRDDSALFVAIDISTVNPLEQLRSIQETP